MIQRVTTQADYLLREAFTGLRRNFWMIWSAVSTLTVLLFLLGLGLQFSWRLEQAVAELGAQLEVSVYLQPGVGPAEVEPSLRNLVGADEVQAIPREQAWQAIQQELGVEEDATDSLGGNPLVDSFRVRVASPEQVSALADQIRKIPGVGEVSYGSEAARQLGQLQEGTRWIGLALIAILAVASVAVISTTIRLIVRSRRKEIEVMQLVGATPLRIAMPFLLEGFTFGVVGALCAWGLVETTIRYFETQRAQLLPFLDAFEQASPTLPLVLFGVGIGLSVMSSLFAVRRALR